MAHLGLWIEALSSMIGAANRVGFGVIARDLCFSGSHLILTMVILSGAHGHLDIKFRPDRCPVPLLTIILRNAFSF